MEFIEKVADENHAGAWDFDFSSVAPLALEAQMSEGNESLFAANAVVLFCRPGPCHSSAVSQAVAWAKGEPIGHGRPGYDAVVETEYSEQTKLLHCIAGNPFLPVSLASSWRTPNVLTLVTAAYNERLLPDGTLNLARLAVLADALEEAGCDNTDILAHLRGPGPHVRGCWAVDLILGKK